MDFFARQDQAHRRTRWLVFYFVSAVVLMIVAIYAVVAYIYLVLPQQRRGDYGEVTWDVWLHPGLLLLVAAGVLLVVGAGSLYKTLELRSGGETVALMLGGRRVIPNSDDPLERRLLNIVEEIAIASGIAVPPVYVLDQEQGINAFAAGWDPNEAVVAVNRGTLEFLSRDELQGVIAHEFSHILNGDMRLNIRLIGLLNGILLVGMVGYYVMRSAWFGGRRRRRSSDKGSGGIVLVGLAVFIIGSIGLLFGRLIKAAVSREREYLADASAVQFTRNPHGIGGALKKIGGLSHGSAVGNPNAPTASHMFFASALLHFNSGLFATHPPLVKRIQALDPQFDGTFPPVQRLPASTTPAPAHKTASRDLPIPRAILPGMGQAIPIEPVTLLAAAGNPSPKHLARSRELIDSLPEQLATAARQPFAARAVAYVLLLDDDAHIRRRQLEFIESLDGTETRRETEQLVPHRESLAPQHFLPLMEILQGTLRELSPPQFQQFRRTVRKLVNADQRRTLFEFILEQMLVKKLARSFEPGRPRQVRYRAMRPLLPDMTVLLSALAHVGHSDSTAAAEAYRAAAAQLADDLPAELLPPEQCSVEDLGKALARLEEATPIIKQRFLSAAISTVLADKKVEPAEAELLRAVSDAVDVPLPPMIHS